MRPDLLLLIADRYEMLAPASVALALRIPIAHIEGGEISVGGDRRCGAQRAYEVEPRAFHVDGGGAGARDRDGRGGVAVSSCRRAVTRSFAAQRDSRWRGAGDSGGL